MRSKKRKIRSSNPGEHLKLLILVARPDGCNGSIAVDLTSGALVKAIWETDTWHPINTFDVVEAVILKDTNPLNSAAVESLPLSLLPNKLKSLRKHKIRKYLKRLDTPENSYILDFLGPSVPYWTITSPQTSSAIIKVRPGMQIVCIERDDSGVEERGDSDNRTQPRFEVLVRMGWRKFDHDLPIADSAANCLLDLIGPRVIVGKELPKTLGYKPGYLVVALQDPYKGYCRKAVVGILPKV
ncbi:MAG: hypothetical protein M1483_08575 [Actinobacteria bacterium]|nr:hypothetical protein [Actinomycetota bacterium]MCL6105656.1 hypothetical protein [Actinomycetota bacterium]